MSLPEYMKGKEVAPEDKEPAKKEGK